MMAHLAGWGNCFAGKFRNADGRLEQLALLHPDRVEVEPINGQPRYNVTDAQTGRESKHGVDDIVHVRAMSADGLVGLSPIAQCRMAVSLSRGMGEFAEAFVRNSARPSGIHKLPAGSRQETFESVRERLEYGHGGATNAHRIAVLSGDVDWTALSVPADDMQFVQQQKLSTAEIARIFRVPPWMIGASSGDSMT